MKRLLLAFVVVTLAEAFAYSVFRAHPISLPGYFSGLLTAIQFVMCYGGIESARWLLRRSPAAHTGGPESDWARLWLWLGPPGGVLMVISSVVAGIVAHASPSNLTPAIFLAHAAGGGILWLCFSLEMLVQLARLHPSVQKLNWTLALTGLATHLCGAWMYMKHYPAAQLEVKMVVLAILLANFVFYYVWASCLVWSIVFRFWTPPPAKAVEHGSTDGGE